MSVSRLLVGVGEAQYHVDLVIGNARGDLLPAAVGEGQKTVYGQSGGIGDLLSGAGGGAEGVLGQDAAVGGAELDHQLLAVVVCHQCNIHRKAPFIISSSGAFSGP